ncbi:hypothetical protein [Tropicibacter naphthalenivorans]|uniref:Uncharacterized protein n=1 Tax=Tropicibacter naphthalenivorans TaxID=441103 RepID=A0A0P1GCD9_9RHOB|nr:hypothetical protein [Tropicibacter naphthalenivorans]CUH79134.1 hypothetical protein TRN7648_02352 [Tropicibacter naphthalenivorans]SMD03334.1 hypothetical protein SAMN04488093_11120 [Tropicibacter naphthalenivorans]
MAVAALVLGSILGFFAGVFSWVVLDFTVLQAFGLYLTASFGCGALALANAIVARPSEGDMPLKA